MTARVSGDSLASEEAEMNAAAVQEQLVDEMLDKIEEQTFLNLPLMNRVEQMLTSRKQLERYIELLMQRVRGEKYMDYATLNRIDWLLGKLAALDRQEALQQ
jgi:hypothetical protein